jgi:hypothetical protein
MIDEEWENIPHYELCDMVIERDTKIEQLLGEIEQLQIKTKQLALLLAEEHGWSIEDQRIEGQLPCPVCVALVPCMEYLL